MIKTVEMRRAAVTLRHPLGFARWGSGAGAGAAEDAPMGGAGPEEAAAKSLGRSVTRAGRPSGVVMP